MGVTADVVGSAAPPQDAPFDTARHMEPRCRPSVCVCGTPRHHRRHGTANERSVGRCRPAASKRICAASSLEMPTMRAPASINAWNSPRPMRRRSHAGAQVGGRTSAGRRRLARERLCGAGAARDRRTSGAGASRKRSGARAAHERRASGAGASRGRHTHAAAWKLRRTRTCAQ